MFSDRFISKLKNADSVVIFTGAGMSADSGVPTFRGEDGIWKKFKAEELARFDAFIRNPELVWEWYRHRKQVMRSIQPHAGYFSIAEMEKWYKQFTIITQNIDNLHRRAGSKNVFELHGNIERNYCVGCGKHYTNEQILMGETVVPHCKDCNGLIRPDVVWFGESLPVSEWKSSVRAAERADVFISIGTSAVVEPASWLPGYAKRAQAFLAEINIELTEISEKCDEVVFGRAAEVLPQLLERLDYSPAKH